MKAPHAVHRNAIGYALAGAALVAGLLVACGDGPSAPSPEQLSRGQEIFRFDTFGDERFWTDTLRMHEVVQQAVTPALALSVGLKVDADAYDRTLALGLAEEQKRDLLEYLKSI